MADESKQMSDSVTTIADLRDMLVMPSIATDVAASDDVDMHSDSDAATPSSSASASSVSHRNRKRRGVDQLDVVDESANDDDNEKPRSSRSNKSATTTASKSAQESNTATSPHTVPADAQADETNQTSDRKRQKNAADDPAPAPALTSSTTVKARPAKSKTPGAIYAAKRRAIRAAAAAGLPPPDFSTPSAPTTPTPTPPPSSSSAASKKKGSKKSSRAAPVVEPTALALSTAVDPVGGSSVDVVVVAPRKAKKPTPLPRDAESKNLYAQRYRLLRERMSFIAHRHRTFYIAQIVNRYPTPRFPYLDQRNLSLWAPDVESRRSIDRIMQDARRRMYEEVVIRVVAHEAQKKEEKAKVDAELLEESTKKSKKEEATEKKGKRKPAKPKKVMNIREVDDDATDKDQQQHAKQTTIGRQTQNSLADSLALETALLLSSADAPMSGDPSSPSAGASPSADAASPPSILSSISFVRSTPLLRVGNFLLYDNPELDDWEPARIVAVNYNRTKMQIERVTDRKAQPLPKRHQKKADTTDEDATDDDAPLDSSGSSSAAPSVQRWIDLDSAHFFEYVDIVWAKMKGFDWWPADLCDEVENGALIVTKGQVRIAFCEELLTIQSISAQSVLPYFDYCEANATVSKMKKKGFEESFNTAEEVWRVHMRQSVTEECARRDREAKYLHKLLAQAPTFYIGKRVSVYWPLDTAWYSGAIKQYNVHTRKHCILYDDDAVEWIDVQKELIVFSSFPLSNAADAELPINPAHVKLIYKTYQHQQYELRDHGNSTDTCTIIGRDFLPDYVPRTIEQVDALKKVVQDPKNAKLIASHATNKEITMSGGASIDGVASTPLDLSTLNCWECGLDLERWHGPGLLSKKYGGTNQNPNKRNNDESEIEVISCGRCTKVVHSFCLQLMLKRKNQTEHALPLGETKSDENADTPATSDEAVVDASEKVLPPHLSCTLKNPRCPDCLRCEHCFLTSNKLASVEDLVTCDICQMRVHLQCIDPAFDTEKHQRPTDGWICPVCVQCRCCGATHSKGGKSTLPPLPPPPGEIEEEQKLSDNTGIIADVTMSDGTTAADSSPLPMDTSDTPTPSPPLTSELTTNGAAASENVEMTPVAESKTEGEDVPAGADLTVTTHADDTAPASVPAAAASASAPKRKAKRRAHGWSKRFPLPAHAVAAAAAAEARKDVVPFSKRFTSKWVDTDEESIAPEEENHAIDEAAARKKMKLENGETAIVKFHGPDSSVESGTDKSFWEWTNSFTVCQPCGYRLEKRKYCPICVVIYDRHTTDPMVQCDSCQRWVHIACDPNAQANEAKLTKDNTQYHCSECLRRERSNELTSLLDDLVSHDKSKLFLYPVNEEIAPDYFLTIKTPMDFTTVYKKLMELQYQGIDQFKYDLNLIWRNAKDYNPAATAIHRNAIRLQQRSMELFQQLTKKHGSAGGLFDEAVGRIEDEEEEKKKAAAEKEARDIEAKRQRALKRQSEMQLPKPPRLQDYYAFFLSFDDIKLAEIDTCLLCGSVGDDADLIFCIDCGECAHSWCYASALEAEATAATPSTALTAHGELDVDTSMYTQLSAEQRTHFRCPNCQICNQCGAQEKRVKVHVLTADSKSTTVERVIDTLVACSQCAGISHVSCVPYLHGRSPRNLEQYRCPSCVICRCCQATTAGRLPSDRWSPDFSLCASCYKLYREGNICPVCDMVYKPRDESTPMMCCDLCESWIHMACDNLKYEEYIALTADASQKYYCPRCRDGTTTEALAERTDKDQARRLHADRRKQEKNKLHQHIAHIPPVLPTLHSGADLLNMASHTFDRIRAAQCRIAAMQRFKATSLMNQVINAARQQGRPIPPLEVTDTSRYERQSKEIFQLVHAISAHSSHLRYDIALLPNPAMQIEEVTEQEISPIPPTAVKEEEPTDETMKVEATISASAASSRPVSADIKPPSSLGTSPQVVASAVDLASMPPLDAGVKSESLQDDAPMTSVPRTSSSSTSSHAQQSLLPDQALTTEQALSYLEGESLHASRRDDWRICAFCHKIGDQETPKGEGRLLPALCVGARWVHVQCALWTDKVSTNAKGQMNVLTQLGREQSVCTVCSLPGATLRCKRGYNSCGKYHFACALSRNCLFTSDKEFHCELHSAKLKKSREATIDKLTRRMVVSNSTWNRFGLFAMRIREVQTQQKPSATDEAGESMTRDELTRQENLLAEHYSDYEYEGDEWKCRKLSFASKATLKAEAEATHRAQGKGRRAAEDEEEIAARPILPKADREALLLARHARTVEETATTAVVAPSHESDDEVAVKEEDATGAASSMVDVAEEEKSIDAPVKVESKSSRRSSRAVGDGKDRYRRKELKGPPVLSTVSKELDRLLQLLPPVFPTTTDVFLRIGALSVTNLGEIVSESPYFHDAEYIYPLGYSATRIYWSYKHPGHRTVYQCEILGFTVVDASVSRPALRPNCDQLYSTTAHHPTTPHWVPAFRLTAADDPSYPLLGESAPQVWQHLMRRFPSFISRNTIRPRMRSGDTWSWSLGGSAFFGLSIKQVAIQIEMMPRAELCRRYKFKQLQRMIDTQKAQAEERERTGKADDDDNKPTAPSHAGAPLTNLDASTAAASSSSSSSSTLSDCARTRGYDRRAKPVVARSGPGAGPSMHSSGSFSAITVLDDLNGARRRNKTMAQNQSGKEVPLPQQYRVMKASAPRARVAHSIIHEWGLFANQDLDTGAIVIEYLGELIRPRVADLRERYYEDTGLDSCYMFKIDDDHIVDSTKRGNISRFINHSCNPNCHTECIDTPQGKKIVVLAERPIAKDEEVTYNYFFASENERIRCNCGAPTCAGRLN